MNPSVSSPKLLRPVADAIYHEGAPFVALSPHRGLRNACVIYEAIKNLPDKTLVRGDFNKNSSPFIYFPDRPKRKIIGRQASLNSIAEKNIEINRKEMAEFIHSIAVSACAPTDKKDTALLSESMKLKHKIAQIQNNACDITVGDIKEPLKKIAKSYLFQNVRKLTSPHRLLSKQASSIQDKRLREFVHMARDTFGNLAEAMRPKSPYHSNKYDTTPELATFEIKMLFKAYLLERESGKINFSGFIRKNGVSQFVACFAKRWLEISLPTPNDERIQFSTEPWAKELDRICPLIIKEQRRSSRIMPTVTKNDNTEAPGEAQLLYRKPSKPSLPPLPTIIAESPSFDAHSPVEQQASSGSSSFFAYSPYKMIPQKKSNEIDDYRNQPQQNLNALSPDTSFEERTSRNLSESRNNLPKFDLDLSYSSINLGELSRPSFINENNHQIVSARARAVSAQELSVNHLENWESSPTNKRPTDQVADSRLEPFNYEGDSFSNFSPQASEEASVKGASGKPTAKPSNSLRSSDTTSSSNLFSVASRSVFSPERSSDSPFTSPKEIHEVHETISTEEHQRKSSSEVNE